MWETLPWELSGQQDSHENRGLQEGSATIHKTWRKKFLDNLHAAGIHMEKVARDLASDFCPPPPITRGVLCDLGRGRPHYGCPRMGGEPRFVGSRAGAWGGRCLCSSLLGQLCSADPHQCGVTPGSPAGTCTGVSSLISTGISSQQHTACMEKKVVHYLLLSTPWSVLCYHAEELRLRVPLQVRGCGAQAHLE